MSALFLALALTSPPSGGWDLAMLACPEAGQQWDLSALAAPTVTSAATRQAPRAVSTPTAPAPLIVDRYYSDPAMESRRPAYHAMDGRQVYRRECDSNGNCRLVRVR